MTLDFFTPERIRAGVAIISLLLALAEDDQHEGRMFALLVTGWLFGCWYFLA